MDKLLIEESPLVFQPSLAVAIGLNEAIVLQQVQYWISNPKNAGYEQGGFKWVYNTYAEWKETNFPFWSESTIQRIFLRLEKLGLIVSIQPRKMKYDSTKYYRVDYDKLKEVESVTMTEQGRQIEVSISGNLDPSTDLNLVPSTDSNLRSSLTYTTPETSAESSSQNNNTNPPLLSSTPFPSSGSSGDEIVPETPPPLKGENCYWIREKFHILIPWPKDAFPFDFSGELDEVQMKNKLGEFNLYEVMEVFYWYFKKNPQDSWAKVINTARKFLQRDHWEVTEYVWENTTSALEKIFPGRYKSVQLDRTKFR